MDGSSGRTLSAELAIVKGFVQDPQLWENVSICINAIEPTISLLKAADSDRLMIAEIWSRMNKVLLSNSFK